jgi:hypothetical protein
MATTLAFIALPPPIALIPARAKSLIERISSIS